MVYRKLKDLIEEKKNERKFIDSYGQLSVLRSLLDHTCQFTRELNTRPLIILVELFHVIGQDLRSSIVNSTLQELRIRLDKLKLKEIIRLLRETDRFLDNAVAIEIILN